VGTLYSTGHLNKDYFILGRAQIADSGDDITSWIDYRYFYGNHIYDIGADFTEDVENPNIYQLQPYSTLENSLKRIRYQLAKAINGGTNWRTTSFPLTAGPTSDADAYHTHLSLQKPCDTFILKSSENLILIPSNINVVASCESIMNQSKMFEWDRISNKGIASVDTLPGSGSVLITLNEIGLFEVEVKVNVVRSGSIPDPNTYYCYAGIAKRYDDGGNPVWNYASPYFSISAQGTNSYNLFGPLLIKSVIYVNTLDDIYNNFIVFSFAGGPPDSDVCVQRKIQDPFNNNFEGGVSTYLKVTKIQDTVDPVFFT
jgi:hypothetical protein